MKIGFSLRRWLVTAVAAALTCCLAQTDTYAQKVIRLGHSEGPDTPHGQTMAIFGKLLEQATSHRYQVRVFPSLQLGPVTSEIQAVKLGTQEMFISTPAWFSSFYPKVDVLSLPYLVTDWNEAERLLTSDVIKKIAADAEKASGIKIIGIIPVGFRNMATSKHAIVTPDDFAGQKIRVQNSPVYLSIFKALKANPVAIDAGEIFLAVQNGVADGLETTYPIMLSTKYYQVAPNISETRHNFDVFLVYMNKAFYDTMSPEDRKAVDDSMRSAAIASVTITMNAEEVSKRGLVTQGAKFHDISKETIATLRKEVQPVYAEFGPKFEPELSEIQKSIATK